MKPTSFAFLLLIILASHSPANAQDLFIDGFVQSLYTGRVHTAGYQESDYFALENRLQLRLEHIGESAEFFGRIDFIDDQRIETTEKTDLREAYLKFRLGENLDFKIGRQILTWGTGDLLFINDNFAKDYVSFFIGRDDQYLKAPQNAIRVEYYNLLGNFTAVWTPKFTPNIGPTGERLNINILNKVPVELPKSELRNSEIALRYSRQVSSFKTALYYYYGFYKNPNKATIDILGNRTYGFAQLEIIGGSIRGTVLGGIVWGELGYFRTVFRGSRLSSFKSPKSNKFLVGYEREIASSMTANIQWLVKQSIFGFRTNMLTSRLRNRLFSDLLTINTFLFYDEARKGVYLRGNIAYKQSDQLEISAGYNIFHDSNPYTEFGQFRDSDNFYLKLTYGF